MQAEDPPTPAAPEAPPARGRPRDPGLQDRVFDAAIAVYASSGWRDFTFDAVARAAGVGKAALYRRWPTRGDLLRETLEARWYRVGGMDTGSLEGDLTALARMIFDSGVGPHGDVVLHYRADLHQHAEVRRLTGSYGRELIAEARMIVRRAAARGELQGDASPALIIDVVVGAMLNRISATPDRLRATMVAKRDQIIADLVQFVIRGAGG